mgnify:CR=1 FL=1
MEAKVRFAPSPTGYLHVGGLRTALFNYIYAKKINAKFVLRIEDTDQSRIVKNALENLFSIFKKINIDFDESPKFDQGNGPYIQSQRLKIYHKYVQKLLVEGKAYPCFCSSKKLQQLRKEQRKNKQIIKYNRHCLKKNFINIKEKMKTQSHVIRMKIPLGSEILFNDLVRNKIRFKNIEIDDQIIIKSDGYPTYHFANVIDDYLMGITHVIRGEEWLSSTPKHIILYNFFNWEAPQFIHLPLLLNKDKSKLSKRQGDVSVEKYLEKGYLPDALINFVALLGWHPENDQEILNIEELINSFTIDRIQKSGAVFDIEKLNWMNKHYMMQMDLSKLCDLSKSYFENEGIDISNKEKYIKVINNLRTRSSTIEEIVYSAKPYYLELKISEENLDFLKMEKSQILIKELYNKFNSTKTNLDELKFKKILFETGSKLNIKGKNLFLPLRIALYGKAKGPEIPSIFSILGIKESLNRLNKAINEK